MHRGNICNLNQAKNIIFVFLVFTIISSLSAAAFVTGNAFAKKSSGDSGGGGSDKGGSSDKGAGSGGGSSDNGGGGGSSSDTSGGGSSDNTGGGEGSDTGGGSSDTGSASTPQSTTAEPPPATEGSTTSPPPPPAAENQKTTCPDGSMPDANGNCPSSAAEQNTASTPAPPQTNQQTCPDGSTQDPTTGVCPPTSEGAPTTNTPQGQPTTNMLTGRIQTAAPMNSPPPPPSSEPFEGCPGHVTRNANGVCLSPLSKDSPCAEGFHHDASGKCVDNTIPLADGTCAGGYSLENIDGKNTCNGKEVGPCPGNVARDASGVCFDQRPNSPCAQGFHRDTAKNGGKCVDNSIPYAGSCELGWHMNVNTGMCARNDVLLPDGTCYAGHHLVTSTTAKGKTLYNCYPNEFPLSSGKCAKTWYFVAAWNGCMPGLPVQQGGKCPKGYHKTLMNVKDKDNLCAADPDTLTKLTTPSQPNQPLTQTGGGTGTGTTPSTQSGGITGTNTSPTPSPTAAPTSEPSSATTTNSPPSNPECVPGYHWDNSQLKCIPDHTVLTQKPESNIGLASLRSPSSQLQSSSPKISTIQKTPGTLFKGPSSVPGGSVPLGNPALVPGPDEEGAAPKQGEDQCIAVPTNVCNFPYPISQDEICRNGMDDDHDGKVDEVPCSEVPGESKPRPSDGTLTPTPGQPLGP
jgi:hypothetical protein